MSEIILSERKIVKQGKFSRIVALPSDFCKANGWDFGKKVVVKTDGKRLILELVEGAS